MNGDFSVLSARFEALPKPLGPGWVMRITASTQNIAHLSTRFVARMAEQSVEFLCVSTNGDLFEGYVRQVPKAGDRLFVGYAEADVPTSVVFGQGGGPAVA